MDILVASGHGKVALRLLTILAASGHTARGLIRNPAHAGDVRATGGVPVLGDLEKDERLARDVTGARAVFCAAGAAPGSGPGRKRAVDLGGAVKLADAAMAESV